MGRIWITAVTLSVDRSGESMKMVKGNDIRESKPQGGCGNKALKGDGGLASLVPLLDAMSDTRFLTSLKINF